MGFIDADKWRREKVELCQIEEENQIKNGWHRSIQLRDHIQCESFVSYWLMTSFQFFFHPTRIKIITKLTLFYRFLFISSLFLSLSFFLYSHYFWSLSMCPYDVINMITQRADSRFPLLVPKWYGIRSRSANMRRLRWCELWTGHIILWQRQFRFVSHRIQFRQKGLINTSCRRRVNIPFTTCRIK